MRRNAVKDFEQLKNETDQLNEAMHKRPEFLKQGQRPTLVNPMKEIDVSKEELEELDQINMQCDKLTMNLGFKRQIYLFEESSLMNALQQGNESFKTKIEMLKKKYKIIGVIRKWDTSKGKLIIQ